MARGLTGWRRRPRLLNAITGARSNSTIVGSLPSIEPSRGRCIGRLMNSRTCRSYQLLEVIAAHKERSGASIAQAMALAKETTIQMFRYTCPSGRFPAIPTY
jgi:hypothetical protein